MSTNGLYIVYGAVYVYFVLLILSFDKLLPPSFELFPHYK